MIDINLIPDVKAEFLKTQATKRLVIALSMLVSGIAVGAMIVFSLYVNGIQNSRIEKGDERINELNGEFKNLESLSEVLTVDRQLQSLPGLHAQKPAMTRLPEYFSKLIPNDISLNNVTIDFDQELMIILGASKDPKTVNKFIDTLKYAVFAEEGGEQVFRVFPTVVMQQLGTNIDDESDNTSSFEVRAIFDPSVFDDTKTIFLTVPQADTDQFELLRPEDVISLEQLFTPKDRGDNDLFEETEESDAENNQ